MVLKHKREVVDGLRHFIYIMTLLQVILLSCYLLWKDFKLSSQFISLRIYKRLYNRLSFAS